MKRSSPSRKISVRKPSHFGSKSHPSPCGSSLTRFASIGKTGGFTGRSIPKAVIPSEPREPHVQFPRFARDDTVTLPHGGLEGPARSLAEWGVHDRAGAGWRRDVPR